MSKHAAEPMTRVELEGFIGKLKAFGETLTPKERTVLQAALRSRAPNQESEDVRGYDQVASQPPITDFSIGKVIDGASPNLFADALGSPGNLEQYHGGLVHPNP